ncbi:MAG: hypothetical protein ABW185_24530 [Sedimenticola sp.]
MIKGIARKAKILLGGLLLVGTSMGASAALLGDGDTLDIGDQWVDGGYAAADVSFSDAAYFTLTKNLKINFLFSITNTPGLVGSGVRYADYTVHNSTSGLDLLIGPTTLNGPTDYNMFSLDLGPGQYRTWMGSAAGGFSPEGGAYNVLATASPVPVPGAAILFGSAVMAFGCISRRRKGIAA